MRLVRLQLANWRGVGERDVRFADGVTLISGPNEIGKSTIVEAIRMLFNELDSSKKKEVKAVQPKGEDVGSSVEAEVKAGDVHFIFAKTYNKSKSTTLDVLAPEKKQLTGREAHQEAQRILAQSVDLALWEALLVDQGEKVGLVHLRDSAGLARALDEAAGSSGAGDEEADLYGAVEAEYEKYFTLKQGRPKYTGDEETMQTAARKLAQAQERLAAVEQDSAAHIRATSETKRLEALMTKQRTKLQELEHAWQGIMDLRKRLADKQALLGPARERVRLVLRDQKRRHQLGTAIAGGQRSLDDGALAQAPIDNKAGDLDRKIAKVRSTVAQLEKQVSAARETLELAHSDEKHCRAVAALAQDKQRVRRLLKFGDDIKATLEIVSANCVTDEALEKMRQAENALNLAHSRRDIAATMLTVSAEKDITVQIGDDEIRIDRSGSHTTSVAAECDLRIPGVAAMAITPPQSAAELQAQYEEAEREFGRLSAELAAADVSQAVASNQRRKSAQARVDELMVRRKDVLQSEQEEEIDERIATGDTNCNAYLQRRRSDFALPADASAAAAAAAGAAATLKQREHALAAARQGRDELQNEKKEIEEARRKSQEDRVRQEAANEERSRQLEEERAHESDAALDERAMNETATETRLEREVSEAQRLLDSEEPSSVEDQLDNAKAVYERAQADLGREKTQQDIMSDRLESARADGRFEEVEHAEREVDEASRRLASIDRRARAARVLYETLGRHRDSTRQAYVRPLKDAIERLGAMVFGAGFEVGVNDDWSLVSRTLGGKTLDFDDLSVGAREQLGILTRLAAAQIVAKQGGVPLIIDDALGFSDAARLEKMGAAIAAAGRSCQIVILTSAPERFAHVGNAEEIRFT